MHDTVSQSMAAYPTMSLTRQLDEDKCAAFRARLTVKKRPEDELQHGAMRGDLRKVQKSIELRADPSHMNVRGVTALMLSASSAGKDAISVLKELHKEKADMQMRDHNGWAALHHACRNGKLEVVRELLELNADPLVVANDHKTGLMLAIMEGNCELVREMLKVKPIRNQISEKDKLGATALHFAVKGGALEITKVLLESSAKANSKDVDCRTPLMWACEHGQIDCARTLAKKGCDLDAKDKSQRSALIYACLSSYEGVALWLLKKCADPHSADVAGDTPLSIAHELGLSELKKFVKSQMTAVEDLID